MKNKLVLSCLLTAFSFTGLATAASAKTERYECTLTKRSNKRPVPEKISMTVDTATDTARAQDVYTRQITSNPVNAGLQVISPRKFSIRWKLTGLS